MVQRQANCPRDFWVSFLYFRASPLRVHRRLCWWGFLFRAYFGACVHLVWGVDLKKHSGSGIKDVMGGGAGLGWLGWGEGGGVTFLRRLGGGFVFILKVTQCRF